MTAGDQAPPDHAPRQQRPGRRPAGRGPGSQPPSAEGPATGQGASAQEAAQAGRDTGGGRPSYEQARDQLTEVVRLLEGGGLTLEQSLELWERGERLASICSEWLEGARARLAVAMPDENGHGDPQAPF